MNRLSKQCRAKILGMMVEGVSIRAINRFTGASKNTITKLLADAGRARNKKAPWHRATGPFRNGVVAQLDRAMDY